MQVTLIASAKYDSSPVCNLRYATQNFGNGIRNNISFIASGFIPESSRPLYAIFICLKIIIHCSENDRRTNAFLEIEFIEHSFISSVIHADFCSEFLHHPIFTLRHNVRFLIDGGEIYRKLFFVYNLLLGNFRVNRFASSPRSLICSCRYFLRDLS